MTGPTLYPPPFSLADLETAVAEPAIKASLQGGNRDLFLMLLRRAWSTPDASIRREFGGSYQAVAGWLLDESDVPELVAANLLRWIAPAIPGGRWR